MCICVRSYQKKIPNYLDVYIFGELDKIRCMLHFSLDTTMCLYVCLWRLQNCKSPLNSAKSFQLEFLFRFYHVLHCKRLVTCIYVWFRLNTIIRTFNNYCYHLICFLSFSFVLLNLILVSFFGGYKTQGKQVIKCTLKIKHRQ